MVEDGARGGALGSSYTIGRRATGARPPLAAAKMRPRQNAAGARSARSFILFRRDNNYGHKITIVMFLCSLEEAE
jgi:hypothetical protein